MPILTPPTCEFCVEPAINSVPSVGRHIPYCKRHRTEAESVAKRELDYVGAEMDQPKRDRQEKTR